LYIHSVLFFYPAWFPENSTMGIPYYFRVITQAYHGIVGSVMPPVDHIFFDFNGAIHQSAKAIIDQKKNSAAVMLGVEEELPIERDIMEAVEAYVRDMVRMVRPKRGVYIYMDGVAPHAKLMQQRKRRYLSMLRYKLLGTTPVWDTNAISPGTMFMTRLAAFLKKRVQEEPLSGQATTRFSFSDENGEAEHKIFAFLARIPHDERVVIHGLDADLIMLSLLSHRPNITLMREQQIGSDFQYLSIDRLREGILRDLSTRHAWPISPGVGPFDKEACDAIESYIVWCFLLGNDFLPHMPTLHLQKNGLDMVLAASRYTMLVDSSRSVIRWDAMSSILEELSAGENESMCSLVSEAMRRKCHAKTDEERVDMYPLLDQNRSDLALEIHQGGCSRTTGAWRPMYYKKLFHTRMHDLTVVSEACHEYMTGMEWTYRYYKRLPRNYTWYYPYPYAPTMSDLANHMATSHQQHNTMVEQWRESTEPPIFIPDYIQLLCILPPESSHILPKRLRDVVSDPSLGCTHMYPRKYPVLTFLKTRLWECSPVLPPLDIALLQRSTRRMITRVEQLKPRTRTTEAFSKGFHIAR
jgi:5'-3' exonuclease